MIRIVAVDPLVLRTDDPAAMLRFHVDRLGCRVERRVDDLGPVQLRAGASRIDRVRTDGAPAAQPRPAGHATSRILSARSARSCSMQDQ